MFGRNYEYEFFLYYMKLLISTFSGILHCNRGEEFVGGFSGRSVQEEDITHLKVKMKLLRF